MGIGDKAVNFLVVTEPAKKLVADVNRLLRSPRSDDELGVGFFISWIELDGTTIERWHALTQAAERVAVGPRQNRFDLIRSTELSRLPRLNQATLAASRKKN